MSQGPALLTFLGTAFVHIISVAGLVYTVTHLISLQMAYVHAMQ